MTTTARRKRLLVLSFSPIAVDARVLKQVRHFIPDYDVVTCGYGESPDGVLAHYQIPDDRPFRENARELLILRRYKRLYWRSGAVTAAQQMLQSEMPFDIIVANDVETVGLALALQPKLGVHADVHEYAPKLNEEDPVWRHFVAPYARWMCRRFLTKVTSVTTVGKGIADEYQRVFGINAEVATNASPSAQLAPTPVTNSIRIVHSGAALRNRGLDKLIRGVEASSASVTLDLYLMPNDLAYLTELTELASKSPRVAVHDPVPQSELVGVLNSYDIGIHVIPPVSFNNAWALPNKFFDYVQARLGLVIGPSPEMTRILEEHHLGAITSGFDVGDIASTLNSLSKETVTTWKENSDSSARALSAESQVEVWGRAVAAIAGRDTPAAVPHS